MPKCPYCGKWFKTKRGLKQHIEKTHYEKVGAIKVPKISSWKLF